QRATVDRYPVRPASQLIRQKSLFPCAARLVDHGAKQDQQTGLQVKTAVVVAPDLVANVEMCRFTFPPARQRACKRLVKQVAQPRGAVVKKVVVIVKLRNRENVVVQRGVQALKLFRIKRQFLQRYGAVAQAIKGKLVLGA